jgi:hypothetical protein
MSSGNPVGGRPDDPFEKYYRLDAVEAAREEARRKDKEQSGKPPTLAAYVLLTLQKGLDFIKKTTPRNSSKPSKKKVETNLVQMKLSLELLMKEDRSQDDVFLKNLSLLWQKILEDSLQFKKMTPLAVQYKRFIKALASYPEGQEYSLAYYLSEYAGQSWLPFPYMELIQKLHTLSEKNPADNPLKKWSLALEELIVLLNQE